jgi:hypothetical protein
MWIRKLAERMVLSQYELMEATSVIMGNLKKSELINILIFQPKNRGG